VRILHVVQTPYGGAVAVMLLLARDQVERHDVAVVCHSAGIAADRARAFGASVWTVPAHRSIRLREDVQYLLRLRRIVRQFRPDVIHLHSSKAGALGRLAARLENVPVVYSPHLFAYRGAEGNSITRGVFYLIERVLAPLTDCLHAVSRDEYESALKYRLSRPELCKFIPNAIDLDPLLALDPPPVRTPPVVGTLARLSRQKRLDLFLDAVAELRHRGVAIRALLIGDGPLRDQLHARARMLQLESTVEFDERRHDAAAALGRMDIFALPSSHEGAPLTVMEAMAAERAVVTTGVGLVPEIVTDRHTGIVVPPGDPLRFADALQQVIEDVLLRRTLAAAGRDAARRRFRPEIMAARMEDLYATAIERRRRTRRVRSGASMCPLRRLLRRAQTP
jgi:glycosyltransferase involved in cell wall biosynthesis